MNLIQCIGSSHSKRLAFHLERSKNSCHRLQCLSSFSFSGAKISDIKVRFKKTKHGLVASVPIVVFIGGNDLLAKKEVSQVIQQYLSMVRLFRRALPGVKLILVALPIFPCCYESHELKVSISEFNQFLYTLCNPNTVVIDLGPHVRTPEYFHRYYPRSRKPDGLHLNHKGYDILVGLLVEALKSEVVCT